MKERIESMVEGLFWTRQEEMVKELETLLEDEAYAVNDEYITFADEDHYINLYIGHANTTMWIQKVELASG